jgi:superfamily I DNA/RNA helicase
VNDVIEAAVKNGNLEGRLEKDFQCFVPDKAADSAAHPKIIEAVCSVQSKKAPYVGRYIVEQIKAISASDVRESHEQAYPTVLVVGPNPFLDAAFHTISAEFPKALRRKSAGLEIDVLDAYRLLAKDESSRLGWRIVIAYDPFAGSDEVLRQVAGAEVELVDLIPDDYRDYHLALARCVGRLLAGEELEQEEVERLEAVAGQPFAQIREVLALAESQASADEDDQVEGIEEADSAAGASEPDEEPSIICTSLIGSKGLSAGHVFIVGFNDGHLPRDPVSITDEEVCQFLVGLSRTRKTCHVVSVRNYGGQWLPASAFAQWIRPHLEPLKVDKTYLEASSA